VERIGETLRKIRQHWKLSLREVEERSLRYVQKWGHKSYQVSASWLDRVERGGHEIPVGKLIVLADIFNIPLDQLLRSMHPLSSPLMLLE
jgi:transcriptional regulator with XRE-family HTH domain